MLARFFPACAILCLRTGCGTVQNVRGPRAPYGGVGWDVDYVTHGDGLVEDVLFRPLAAVDTPLSLVGDTLTLPFTIAAKTRPRLAKIRERLEEDRSSHPRLPNRQLEPALMSSGP